LPFGYRLIHFALFVKNHAEIVVCVTLRDRVYRFPVMDRGVIEIAHFVINDSDVLLISALSGLNLEGALKRIEARRLYLPSLYEATPLSFRSFTLS